MAHKTLIGGTAYEISGGKTLVDGTAYEIKNGKTLVGGTAYEVGFGVPCAVTITGDSSYQSFGFASYAAYAQIDGVKYGSPATITVNRGDTITCGVKGVAKNQGQVTHFERPAHVYLNGTLIYTYEGDSTGSYNYTVQGDITIKVEHLSEKYSGIDHHYGNLYITEQ